MSITEKTFIDHAIQIVDQGLRTLWVTPESGRPYPAAAHAVAKLSHAEQGHVAGLMRVNHTGEVCAQALYQAQALTARQPEVAQSMAYAALEENDHLNWCARRLEELGSHTSYLNPLWYLGAFHIGLLAGWCGDGWNLGFVAETEKQVVAHLQDHLSRLPIHDARSEAIMTQMQIDEAGHADAALTAGGLSLPSPIKQLMRMSAKVMTTLAYHL